MWQPRWLTIDDLMQEVSGLHSGERIRLIAELYKVYSACHDEPFDKFYFWGEMLLNDFDTIDKYRIDADVLFRNIYELKELESDVSYLTPEQLEVIRQFWANFTDGATLSEENAVSWLCGGRWATSTTVSAHGCNVRGSPTAV